MMFNKSKATSPVKGNRSFKRSFNSELEINLVLPIFSLKSC